MHKIVLPVTIDYSYNFCDDGNNYDDDATIHFNVISTWTIFATRIQKTVNNV